MFNFPDIPSVGQIYAPDNGPSWKWNGVGWESLVISTPPFPVVAGIKLILQSATSFFFAPTSGNDTTGDGSLANPFKTVSGTLKYIETHIDTNHQQILINWKTVGGLPDPGILRDTVDIDRRLLNQDGSSSTLYIRGHINPTSIEDLKQFTWSPPVNSSAVMVGNHAGAHIKGFWFDQEEAFGAGMAESEALTVAERQADGIAACRAAIVNDNGALLHVEDCGFGFNPVSYVSTQYSASTQWIGNFWSEASNVSLVSTTVEKGNNKIYFISVDENEIPLHVLMGVSGSTIPPTAYVINVGNDGDGNFIVISEYPTETTLEETLILSTYTSRPFSVTENSSLVHGSDNIKGGGITWISKRPHFLYGFIFADENSHAEWGSVFMSPDATVMHKGTGLEGEYTLTINGITGVSVGYFAHNQQIPTGAKVTVATGDDASGIVTLDKPLAQDITTDDVVFGALPVIVGYKFTANLGSSIRPTGPNDPSLMPGKMPYYGGIGGTSGSIANNSAVQGMLVDQEGGARQSGYMGSICYDGGYTNLEIVNPQDLVEDKIYYVPFRIRETRFFTGIGFKVLSPGTATQLKLGVYNARLDAIGHPPYDLIFDAGMTTVDTTGIKEFTISQKLVAGEYWIGVQVNGTVTIGASAGGDAIQKFGSTLAPGVTADLLFSQAQIFSNGLPLVGTIELRGAGTFPNIFIRTGA